MLRDGTRQEIQARLLVPGEVLIAFVAVGAGIAFLPIGLAAGLSVAAAASFAIGLLVANVPERLLPTITLALAVGVREMARRGALVKRLSAVETLGSTSVICTDKTGTLTENRMRVSTVWTPDVEVSVPGTGPVADGAGGVLSLLAQGVAACNNGDLLGPGGKPAGDPTELELLELAASCGADVMLAGRQARRRQLFRFDPGLKLMTTIDDQDGCLVVNTKGAPEEVLARATRIRRGDREVTITDADRDEAARVMTGYAQRGLRVLAVARRVLPAGSAVPAQRQDAEQDMCLTGMAAMLDPLRPQVPAAIAQLHRARIRVNVVTGDNGLTAAAIARHAGVGSGPRRHEGGHRHRAGRDDRNPARRPARVRHRSSLRAQLPRSQAAHRRCASLRRPGRRDDRRRGQRLPRAAPRGHRRRDGSLRD